MPNKRREPFSPTSAVVELYRQCRELASQLVEAAAAIRNGRREYYKLLDMARKLEAHPRVSMVLIPPSGDLPPPFSFEIEDLTELVGRLLGPVDESMRWRVLTLIAAVCVELLERPCESPAVALMLFLPLQKICRAAPLTDLEILLIDVAADDGRVPEGHEREVLRNVWKGRRPRKALLDHLGRDLRATEEYVWWMLRGLRLEYDDDSDPPEVPAD